MNITSEYTQFALVREMMETPVIIRDFKLKNHNKVVEAIRKSGKLFFTGEGSSRSTKELLITIAHACKKYFFSLLS